MTEPNGRLVKRVLRDRDGIWRQIAEDRGLRTLSGRMLFSSTVSFVAYGAVLGASNGVPQAISSAVKLPLLFLGTMFICLPTLYLFNLIRGVRLSFRQAQALVITAITAIAMLSLAFLPIVLFFLVVAPDYEFYKMLNVIILTVATLVGLRFLVSGMRKLNMIAKERAAEAATVGASSVAESGMDADGTEIAPVRGSPVYLRGKPAPRTGSVSLLYAWIVVFAFVGTQLAWTLRPFIGNPAEPFQVFRTYEGNIYVDIFRTIGQLFG
ncbi:hypothetical protein [Stackebrandtia nassauensis]|uniref:Actin-binding WH2 domain-containing protein n=1 Tax=Stackebrandtia nassauensis (strain DSM 44728 / CIP 108903 / NRRL B-16338 / NBRC 102104 / LLR-40K-21) TaxID=446470 RepID=D3PZA3_STANL|nr:hypothetical protein [Stackebrandtia nassauensis]ADD41577.1 hypothetical protein Snas_1881 [Stackebrandtia nassauensis DSM 44728]